VTLRWYATVVEAVEPQRLASFWAAALGWTVAYAGPDEVAIEAPDDPQDRLPAMLFVRVAGAKAQKNRLHLDLDPDDQTADVQRLLALGASHVDIGQRDVGWVVLADPEGNEFCVLRPRAPVPPERA
jgi:predicted enzyme related to lactoylglutathione lyase